VLGEIFAAQDLTWPPFFSPTLGEADCNWKVLLSVVLITSPVQVEIILKSFMTFALISFLAFQRRSFHHQTTSTSVITPTSA